MANEFKIRNGAISPYFVSTVPAGTAPLSVTSTTPVANLSVGGNAATATNADQLDGSHRDTAYNSYGNGTIPVRHSSGYLYSNYFNCTADITTSAPTHVAIQTGSDNFIRWQTLAQFQTNLNISAGGVAVADVLAYSMIMG